MSTRYPDHSKLPKNKKPYVLSGARSAFARSFGAFESMDALELYSRTVSGLIHKANIDPYHIQELSCGVVVPQTKNGNLARDTVINLGLAHHIHGYTLNRACTSSLQTISDAARSILAGHQQLVIAGGIECLSDVPIVYSKEARKFLVKLNKSKSIATKLGLLSEFSAKAWIPKPPGITEPMTGLSMGEHSEIMAKKNQVTRAEQDEFALMSHKKAVAAQKNGYLASEIVPIWPVSGKGDAVDKDNLIREDSSLESLSRIKPAFDRTHGTITAGNSSPLTDGAAVCLIGDEEYAKSLGLAPQILIRDMMFVSVDPRDQLLIGPAIAIPLLARRNGLQMKDIDYFEIHEAFAAQVLSCLKSMASKDYCLSTLGLSSAFGEIPLDRLNVNGGAIAIGHPFGATGARLVTSLSNQLIRSKAKFGMIGICAQGGIAGALLLEQV